LINSYQKKPALPGGLLELHPDDTAMLEITDPPLDGAARTVFVPVAKLRLIKARPPRV
jgi:hypothetical protein